MEPNFAGMIFWEDTGIQICLSKINPRWGGDVIYWDQIWGVGGQFA